MIKAIPQVNNNTFKKSTYTNEVKPQNKKELHKAYADSFLRNAKESTPMLLALTSIVTVLDYGKKQDNILKVLKKDMLRYFLPILIASSTICSIIENKKPKKV